MENYMFTSKTALSKLKLTPITKLNLDELAKGQYILARIINEWHNITDIIWSTKIEDHTGHVIRFDLYLNPPEDIFYPRDIIIIKEPYFCSPVPTLRCYSPTDIVVLRPSHPWYPKVKLKKWQNDVDSDDSLKIVWHSRKDLYKWIEKGLAMHDRGDLILAREVYIIAIKMSSTDDWYFNDGRFFKKINLRQVLLLVQLDLGNFEWVVENAENYLRTFPGAKKLAYICLGKAYHLLRNYGKALEIYQKFYQKFPQDEEARIKLERATERIRESNGELNFENLRAISLEDPTKEIDCADFCGPVKITEVAGKGRGLVLTRDVSEGSLLLVSKALVSVLNASELTARNWEQGEILDSRSCFFSVMMQLAQLIMKNPKTIGPLVYDLYPGRNYTESVQLFCDPELQNEPISDTKLLTKITDFNVIFNYVTTEYVTNAIAGCGLFLLPSYMNHSCVPNTITEFYNDVMVVKALTDMAKGTELTRNYEDLEDSFEGRTRSLELQEIKCDCEKCEKRL